MRNELHIHLHNDYNNYCLTDVSETAWSIRTRHKVIHTTMTHFFSTYLLRIGYDLIVHTSKKEWFEVRLIDDKIVCDRTDKELRMAHNLEKMLWGGRFCDMSNYEY